MTGRQLLPWIVAGSMLIASENVAHADGSDSSNPRQGAHVVDGQAEADRLFRDGLAHMKADRCKEAIPLFLESTRIDEASATVFNVGECQARLGKTGTALRAFQYAVRIARRERNDELRLRADTAIAKLDPKVAKLRVVIPHRYEPVVIFVNGDTVYSDPFAVPIDAGENVVEVIALGGKSWRAKVTPNAATTVMTVEMSDVLPPPRSEPGTAPPPPTNLRGLGALVGGVGVVGLVVAGVMAVNASSSWNESSPYCISNHCTQRGYDLRETAYAQAAAATWSTVLGAAAVGAGTAIWILFPGPAEAEPAPPADASRARLVPWWGASRALASDQEVTLGLSIYGRL